MKINRLIKYLLFCVIVLCLMLPPLSWSQQAEKILFKQESENPPTRITWIGILQGTWKEMGIKYGQMVASDIRKNFEVEYLNEVVKESPNTPWHKGKDLQAREKYAAAYIRKSYQEYGYLAPEMIEFMESIAHGAKSELDMSKYGKEMTNFEKIAFLNFGGIHFHPSAYCNGAWVKGKATKTGETYVCRAGQGGFTDSNARQVAYVGIPKDPNARVYWSQAATGTIALSGAVGIMNDCGVSGSTAGAQYKEGYDQADETVFPGAKDFPLTAYAVIFSKTAREAADKFSIGTPKYRAITGRKTVLKARGSNVLFADPNEAYVVESTSKHYVIRTPGYLGEKDGNYIVYANDFQYKDGSYDENNRFRTDQPMTKYCPQNEGSSTYYRFWTPMWDINNNYGKIDREMMLRDIVTAHYAYDKNGKKYDTDSATGAPTVPGTFCAHSGKRTKETPLGTGGNNGTSVMVLSSCEVYWVSAWPCTYKDKPWNYLDLKPYSEYRKMLWGY